MNEFLDRIFLDNPVKLYLIVGGVMLFVLILKRFISHYLAGLIYTLVRNVFRGVDKKSFSDLVTQPLGWFLLIWVSILALHKLTFPALFEGEVYGYSTKQIIHTFGTIVLIISFIWLLLRMIDLIALIM
jgi:MscS family membrane protein